MISINRVKEIINMLPIGYYLGYKIELVCMDSRQSYYDPMSDKIVIGYQQLPLDTLKEDDPEVENNIRCMVYHEVSHVILTPYNAVLNDKTNTFEDQRIETLLRKFYLRVNFREFVKKVNDYKPDITPKNPFEYFYQIVRYNEGPKKFVKMVYEIIYKYRYINSTYKFLPSEYENAINELYNLIEEDFNKRWPKPLVEESEDEKLKISKDVEKSDSKEEVKDEENSESEEIELEILKSSDYEPFTEDEKTEIENTMCVLLKGLFGRYSNEKLSNQIYTIIENAQRKKRNRGAAIKGYSGELNPKRIARPGHIENYKWFEKEARKGDFNRFDKTQLNLFCDVSGSFRKSETKINELIKCLIQLEKKNQNFKFKLIAMGNKNRIVEDNKRFVSCCEGNYLTNDILDIYKKVQTPNTTIYNIVVFDGDAQSFDGACGRTRTKLQEENQKAWSAWNHQNCVIISDNENKIRLDNGSPNAKRIYTKNYTEELEKNILTALGLLVK